MIKSQSEDKVPEEEIARYRLKRDKSEEHQPVSFTIGQDKNGEWRPTVEEMQNLKTKLEPIRAEAEKEISKIIDTLSKNHKVFIQVDNSKKPMVNFIYSGSNFI